MYAYRSMYIFSHYEDIMNNRLINYIFCNYLKLLQNYILLFCNGRITLIINIFFIELRIIYYANTHALLTKREEIH